jgi:adenine-specific DNA-methyltransferase
MTLKELKPKKVLNKAFLKVKPNRSDIENFKANLVTLLDRINDAESEEFHKNLVIDFLKKTYYDPNFFVNTKGRNDLVIHNSEKAKSTVGVIIEAKKPTNKAEMLSAENINKKAFQELVLYYLRERITHKNLEIKHLVATNINEWFIFDVVLFERLFAQNKGLVKQFEDFEAGRLADIKTDFFYKQIAEPFIAELKSEIEFTYFNIQDYQKPLRNNDKKDDNTLIALFKLLSPEHLLKVPFANDSNSLDKRFYAELLHIIGLTETKDGGKKLIGRNIEKDRNSGSILEDAIIQLDSLDKLSRLPKASQYGSNTQEKLFSVALELSITWINRILFLKLLEAQLISYHKGDVSYAFLSYERIKNFDDLNSLFFQVLAKKYEDRNSDVKIAFEKVPYLNSSLFEPTEIEQNTLFISNLKDDKTLPILSQTVLKDQQGKKRTGNITTLEYLFEFLNAYDFSSEGSEDIQEDNKTLINASVLGLIFEKINGYKDGSFFTPGFITMYMCRETLRKSVVQKFNELKNWNCTNLEDLYDKIEDRTEANAIVNSIKICDPAVGSGHFLVSALNEMIAIKNDLKILQDRDFKRLKEYQVEVVNDELVVTDEDGGLFEYNPNNKESQRIQETLFHEKQTIIENCLFGVDINPNSVKICRLRLWIELLKNAYYKNPTELETLPNIDINIKNGNSLVSRFALDADLKTALKSSKWTIDSYRIAVSTYRNADSKEQKREMEQLIADIKSDFRSEISLNDPKVKKLRKLSGDLFQMTNQGQLFEMSKKEKSVWNKRVETLTKESKKLEAEIEEIKANKIYENAFEWRFEFPEVLNDDGDFIGFDVVLGNPPYVQLQKMGKESDDLGRMGFETFAKTGDIYSLFYELGYNVLKQSGLLTYITSNKWMRAGYGENTRKFFVEKTNPLVLIDFGGVQIFDSATVDTNILMLSKESNQFKTLACVVKDKALKDLSDYVRQNGQHFTNFETSDSWVVLK